MNNLFRAMGHPILTHILRCEATPSLEGGLDITRGRLEGSYEATTSRPQLGMRQWAGRTTYGTAGWRPT